MIQRVWVASEDTSTAAPEVVAELARHVLRAVASARRADETASRPAAFQRIEHLRFIPARGPGPGAMAHGAWRARHPKHAIDLRKWLATELSRTDQLVVLHLDADCAWGEQSLLVEEFVTSIIGKIPTGISAFDLGRLLCLCPHRHVEAWCHQNLDALRDLARKPAEHALIDAWAADRAALDRHPNPKDAFSFKNAHNLTLATSGWPRPQVVQAGASFAHTVVGWAWSRAVAEFIEGRPAG